MPGAGRFVSTSRNVRSNGIVTDESLELRLIKLSPGFTRCFQHVKRTNMMRLDLNFLPTQGFVLVLVLVLLYAYMQR